MEHLTPQAASHREYDHFERYYAAGVQWADHHAESLIPLCLGKQKNRPEFERRVRRVFDQLGLAFGLATHESSHPRYRNDVEFARRRFTAGVFDTVIQKASQRTHHKG